MLTQDLCLSSKGLYFPMKYYSWHIAKVGVKHQSLSQSNSSFMTFNRGCNQINTTGVKPEFILDFLWGSCYLIFSFMCMFGRLFFVLFPLTIVLSVLRFTDHNYHFGIFKIFSLKKYTKSVSSSHQSKKDRQYNDQKKKDKRTNNDLQNTTQKTNDRATRTTLKWGGRTQVLHRVSSSCSMSYYSYYKTSDKSRRKKGSDCD